MSRFTEAGLLFRAAHDATEMAREAERVANGGAGSDPDEPATTAIRLYDAAKKMTDEALRLLAPREAESWLRQRIGPWLITNRFPPVTISILWTMISGGPLMPGQATEIAQCLSDHGYVISTRVHGDGPLNDAWVKK